MLAKKSVSRMNFPRRIHVRKKKIEPLLVRSDTAHMAISQFST